MTHPILTQPYEVNQYLRPFPSPMDVFVEPVAIYAEHILPLISVDLSLINPQWSGWIHFVSPIDPYSGVIAKDRKPYRYYLRQGWIGFRLKDGRYELMGDIRYFFLENSPLMKFFKRSYKNQERDLLKHYQKARKSYEIHRQEYLTYDAIYHRWAQKDSSGRYPDKDRVALINELGGQSFDGNWSSGFPFLEKREHDEDGDERNVMLPLTEDGRPFYYIGDVTGFHYFEGGADGVLLFYDPQEQIALVTFDCG
jgi:hypothetical protein